MQLHVWTIVLISLILPVGCLIENSSLRRLNRDGDDHNLLREAILRGAQAKRWTKWVIIMATGVNLLMGSIGRLDDFMIACWLTFVLSWPILHYRQRMLARLYVSKPSR